MATVIYDAMGRTPIAVNQPNRGGDDYPFVGASDLSQLIADLALYYQDTDCTFVRPFYIEWLYGFGCVAAAETYTPVHDRDMRIIDANGALVFDTRNATDYAVTAWSSRIDVTVWQDTASDTVLRVANFTTWTEDETPRDWDVSIDPTDGQLDERVSEMVLPRLRSLRVELGSQLQENITLGDGYNAETEILTPVLVDGQRRRTSIVLHMDPGDGKGQYGPAWGPEDDPLMLRINNVTADATGNFLLDTEPGGCQRWERPIQTVVSPAPNRVVTVRDHTLQVQNECGVCCSCDDFINTFEGIRRLRDRYAALIARARVARDLYVANLERFQAQSDCRLEDPLRIVVRPICPDSVGVAGGFCNNTDACIQNLVIPFSFTYTNTLGEVDEDGRDLSATTTYDGGVGDPVVRCDTVVRSGNVDENPQKGSSPTAVEGYRLGGAYPNYYAVWERVNPGSLAAVTFRLDFVDSIAGDELQLVVDAYAPENPASGSLTGPTSIPLANYTAGQGPSTADHADRLVSRVKKVQAGLLQEDCCDTDSLSET